MKFIIVFIIFLSSVIFASQKGNVSSGEVNCNFSKDTKIKFLNLSGLIEVIDLEDGIDQASIRCFKEKNLGVSIVLSVGRFSTLLQYENENFFNEKYKLIFETGLIKNISFKYPYIYLEIYSNSAEDSIYFEKIIKSHSGVYELSSND